MKLLLKILAVVLVLFVGVLIAIPFIAEKKIDTIVRASLNDRFNATVDYEDISLSLIKSFPKANLSVDALKVITHAPFENDTLVYAKQLSTSISLMQLIKGVDKGIKIDKIKIEEAVIKALVNKGGKANYDIALEDSTKEEAVNDSEASGDFNLNLNYEIHNSRIIYADSLSKTYVTLSGLTHTGKGDVSASITDLDTHTEMDFSFAMGGVNYTHNMPITLAAIIGVDQNQKKYTFKENAAKVNQIPIEFTGWVQSLEAATIMDIAFTSKSGSFEDLLASIPKAYKTDLKGVNAKGKFDLSGTIKGKSTDTSIPQLAIKLDTENASFKYPDLPKGIDDITIKAEVNNTTGLSKDTYVDISAFKMKIDEDRFSANGKLSNLSENLRANIKAEGTLNLANLNQAYPVSLDSDLKGIVNANVQTNFDMASIEKEQYQKIRSTGQIQLNEFLFSSAEMPNAIQISNAKVDFKPGLVTLQEFAMKTGTSDVSATGTLENLIPFVFSDKVLKGNFKLNANNFKVQDFLTEATEEEQNNESKSEEENTTTEGLIPSFLDITSSFTAKTVLYDNLKLLNTSGQLTIKDQKAILKDVTTSVFGGQIGLSGLVDSSDKNPKFDMNLDMKKLDLSQSFQGFDMLQKITPVASALQGLFSTKINLAGSLKEDMTPNLASLKGDALANILNAKVDPTKNNLVNKLNQNTSFLDLNKLNLKDITTKLNFDNGKINVKPFDFKLTKDIAVTASGGHTFDAGLDYKLDLNLPVSYLGNSASGLLSKLSAKEQEEMKVPVPITLGGTFKNPKVGLNMKNITSDLTKQIVANQKQKLKQKATDKVKKEVSKQLSGKAKDVLGGLLGGSKKGTDTTEKATDGATETKSKEDAVKQAAGNLINGLFGKKK